jgi:exopolyphosphatase/guanosine-5'-triphosphate,3'-diphosphate pyrophosphatase
LTPKAPAPSSAGGRGEAPSPLAKEAQRAATVAALDVGTNTVRLLVATVGPGSRLVPHRYALRITRLGGSATPAGLAPAAIERTVAAIAEFARIMREEGATACRAVATSAAREAPNAAALVIRAREAAGVDLEIISGEEEAALALTGVCWALGRLPGGVPPRFALVDVGGGSTEVVLAERARPGWRDRACSMRIGTVCLVERYLRSDPPTREELSRMVEAIEARLTADLPPVLTSGPGAADMTGAPMEPAGPGARVPARRGGCGEGDRRVPARRGGCGWVKSEAPWGGLVGTAGTITTLAAMDLGLTTYDRARIEGHRLTREALDARFAQLVAMPASARLALPGLERGREDLIVPGLAIVLAIMHRLGSPDLTVVDAGLLEGICLTGFGGAP